MKVSIIGTGYVGLVSGICLARSGHEVACVDKMADKVARINAGEPPIHERGLPELLRELVGGRFRATTDLAEAVRWSEVTMIAVGTPFNGGQIDLGDIRAAAAEIGRALRGASGYHVVVVKSTVVPGTTEDVVGPLVEQGSGLAAGRDFGLGMNPEFLREGEAIADFLAPDRIVLGGIDARTLAVMAELYAPFAGVDTLRVNPRTAEMIKYAANSLLATMISFSNEIANLCARLPGVDVVEVMRGVHLDKRLSPILEDGRRITPAFTTYLEAGCGFGGSCFPKDVKALTAFGEAAGSPMRILRQVIEVNAGQPQQVLELLGRHFPDLRGVRVAVMGLAFKPGTDDLRESPAVPVVNGLRAAGALVTAYDPVAGKEAARLWGDDGIRYADTMAAAVHGAQAVVVLTRWPEFGELPALLGAAPDPPLLVDGRRMLDRDCLPRYEGIGLGPRAEARPEEAAP